MSREGFIYKLCCDGIDDFYIGSSFDMIKRIGKHKSIYYNINSKEYNKKVYKFIRENKGFENWKFEILETALFENKTKLLIREQYFIDTLKPTLNIFNSYTSKEYKKEYDKQKNKKQLAIKINCVCGGKTSKADKSHHDNTKRHIKYITNNITINITNLNIN